MSVNTIDENNTINEAVLVMDESKEQSQKEVETETVTNFTKLAEQPKQEPEMEEEVRFLSMSGTIYVTIPGLDPQPVDLVSTAIVFSNNEDGEIFLLFGEPIESGLEGDTKYKLKLNNGRYVKPANSPNGTMYFQGSALYYNDDPIVENMNVECDQNRLHMDKVNEVILKKPEPKKKERLKGPRVIKDLPKEAWDEFEEGDQIFLAFEEDGPKIMSYGDRYEEVDVEVGYETLDGKAEVVDAVYDPESNSSTGTLVLHDFLVRYLSPSGKTIVEKQMEVEDKAIEGVTVTFSGKDDDILQVEQKKEHRLELEVEPEAEFKGVTVKVPLILENIGIKDGNLVIGSARIDVWASGEVNPDKEKLQKLFSCEISGSIAYSSESVTNTKEGVEVTAGGFTMGSFSVKNFLGYLNGEGDYRDGYITVTSSKEKEADTSKLFKFGDKDLGEGLEFKLPPPLDALQVNANLYSNASIGGEVGATIRWEKDTLAFEDGHFKINGMASVTGSIGLKLNGVIVSAGVEVSGNMVANLEAGLSAGTSFSVQEVLGEKIAQQATDLEFSGEFNASLDTGVALTGNMNFLFWKKQLFEVGKEKEGIVAAKVNFKGRKDKNKKGLTEGWEMEEGKAFFQALTKESINQLRIKETTQEHEERVDEILKDLGQEAKESWEAWVALGEMKKRKKDVGIVLEEGKKKTLESQVDEIKKKAQKKINKHKSALEKEQEYVKKCIQNAKDETEAEAKLLEETKAIASERDDFRQKALWGGFREEDIEKDPAMTSIHFIMQNALGEVSEENYERIRKKRHISLEQWEQKSEEEKDEIYRQGTTFGEREYDSFHWMLGRKIRDLNSEMHLVTESDKKKEKKLGKKFTKQDNSIVANQKKLQEQEAQLQKLMDQAKKEDWDEEEIALKTASLKEKIDDTSGKVIRETISKNKNGVTLKNAFLEKFPAKYRQLIDLAPEITIKELLEIAIEDQYSRNWIKNSEGKMDFKIAKADAYQGDENLSTQYISVINATAQEKEQLLEACFHTVYKVEEGGIFNGGKNDAEEASDAWKKRIEQILKSHMKTKEDILKKGEKKKKLTQIQERRTTDHITLRNLIELTNEERTHDLVASSAEKIAESEISLEKLEAEEQRLKARSDEMSKKLKECEENLERLKAKANEALTDKNMDAKAATEAVNIYTETYLGKIKKDSENQEKAGDALVKKLKDAGINLEEEKVGV